MRSCAGPSKDRRKLSICSFGGARVPKAHAVGRIARGPGHRRRSAGLVGEAVGSEPDPDELALLQRELGADLAAPRRNVLGHPVLEPATRAELDGDPYLVATVPTRVVSGHGGMMAGSGQRCNGRRAARKGTASPAPTDSAIASLVEWPVESRSGWTGWRRTTCLRSPPGSSSTVTSSGASLSPAGARRTDRRYVPPPPGDAAAVHLEPHSRLRRAAARGAQCTRSQADRHGVPGSGSSSATWGRWSLAGRRPEPGPLGSWGQPPTGAAARRPPGAPSRSLSVPGDPPLHRGHEVRADLGGTNDPIERADL